MGGGPEPFYPGQYQLRDQRIGAGAYNPHHIYPQRNSMIEQF